MKKKIFWGLIIATIAFINLNYSTQESFAELNLEQLYMLTTANAENNDCTASSYGHGAYLKEQNCTVTSTVYIFPIGWTTTIEDGYKKCCTKDTAAPSGSSCYGDSETVCHKA